MMAKTKGDVVHVWLGAKRHALTFYYQGQWRGVDGWQALIELVGTKPFVCLYVPSHHILVERSSVSARHLKKLGESGIQYVFEPIALSPVQDLVVRYEEKVEFPYLYALSLGDIQMWQQSASLFVEVAAILPDFLLLPIPMPEAMTLEGDPQAPLAICAEAALPMIRLAKGFGTSVASLSLLTTFAPTALTPVVTNIENNEDAALTQWAQQEHISITPPSVLSVVESPQSHALNFLTAPPSRQLSLKPVIGLLILALLLKISFDVATGYYYQYATTQLVHTSHEQYQAWFGHAPNARTSLKAQAMPYLQHTQAQQVPDAILAQLRQLGGLERVHITQQQDAWQITAQTSLIDTSAAQDALKQLGAQVQAVTHEAGSDLTILIQQPSQ